MRMIDIGEKDITNREAVVVGKVHMKPGVVRAIKDGKVPKGDVLGAAQVAGILAAKRTPDLIPLCHPIPINYVNIEFSLGEDEISIKTIVKGQAKTGVEMEALTATVVAALTIYDMCKALDREIKIAEIRLLEKRGGKSGEFRAKL